MSWADYKPAELPGQAEQLVRVFASAIGDYSPDDYVSLLVNPGGEPFLLHFRGKTYFYDDGKWYEYEEVS